LDRRERVVDAGLGSPAQLIDFPQELKNLEAKRQIRENKHMGLTELRHFETRRRFLGSQAGRIAAALSTAAAMDLLTPRPLLSQTELTPDAALQELMAGNKRYTGRRITSFQEDLSILRQNTAEKQEPFAAVLSCADSRVPVEIIFDQIIGHVFVTRVAGNVVTPEIIASLEYGAIVLGTKVILVLGHGNCGAVKAAIQGKEVPGQISALFAHIQRAVDEAGSNLNAAIDANAQYQSVLLSKSSPVISNLIKDNKLKVVAGRYDVVGGGVTLL
jgi:carbonic anhydrase